MADYALLTAMGKDRPGIVAALAGALFEGDCNVEDSTMARLGGDFVVMLVLRLPEQTSRSAMATTLETVANNLELTLQLNDLSTDHAIGQVSARPVYVIHVYGADHKGIVARVTSVLADREIAITNLNTHVIPHADPLYVMMIEIELPQGVDAGQLTSELRHLGADIGVQITVRPKDDARF